jgi:late competence protein required for DNA uptake (superfamily II DNA/RNA helicase)
MAAPAAEFSPVASPGAAPDGALMGSTTLSVPMSMLRGAAETYFCNICLDDRELQHSVVLPCGHRFCRDCFAAFLHSKVRVFVRLCV